jgi:hypothetical protein
MCNYDLDPPEFFESKLVKARREHHCCECGEAIAIGSTYLRNVGKWDYGIDTYRQCARCARIVELHQRRHPNCNLVFGGLFEELRQNQRDAMYVADRRRKLATTGPATRSKG